MHTSIAAYLMCKTMHDVPNQIDRVTLFSYFHVQPKIALLLQAYKAWPRRLEKASQI